MTLSTTMLCYYAECRVLFIIMLNVIMQSVIMLSGIILTVVAPNNDLKKFVKIVVTLTLVWYSKNLYIQIY